MILKICGITRVEDALHAVEHGATALGFVFWPKSPRYVAPDDAARIIAQLPAGVTTVGVFVNEPVPALREIAAAARVSVVQLHGDEPADYSAAVSWPLFRSVTLDEAAGVMAAWDADVPLLLDAADRERRGGTGQRVDWRRAALIARQRRVILAGGLTPDNVAAAIASVDPYGVDVSSGVEAAPGIKDATKVARFLEHAREAFERSGRGRAASGAPAMSQGPADRAGKS
jgi:phosphoribosylanthranilate isomerase